MTSLRPSAVFSLVAVGLLCTACPKSGGTDGGGPVDSGIGNPDSGMTPDSGNTPDAGTQDAGPSPDGGPVCTPLADAYCAEFELCEPSNFAVLVGDLHTCETLYNYKCQALIAAGSSLFADPAGCLAQLTANCGAFDSIFYTATQTSGPCAQPHGTLDAGAFCTFTSQCQAGFACNTNGACTGTCVHQLDAGAGCSLSAQCDQASGYLCAPTFVPPNTTNGTNICQIPNYVDGGAQCAIGSSQDCAPGFFCSSNLCTPVLPLGALCDGGTSLCNTLAGDTCLPNDAGNATLCTGYPVAPVGGACGQIGTDFVQCDGNAACDSGADGGIAGSCVALPTLNQACTGQCAPGLNCTGGNCLPVCPNTL